MTPWLILAVLTAALNLFAFIWMRGRWGRGVALLGLGSLLGTVAGNAIGDRIGLHLLSIGDFRFAAAAIGAQLAMLVVLLLGALGPTTTDDETRRR